MRTRWVALMVLCAAMLMIILDGTSVAVALPVIQRDLDLSPAGLTWVVNAYLIAFGGLLLLSGRLGDLLGRRRVFAVGLGVFTTASLACGLAQTPAMLIAARFVQGAGGAMSSAVSLGMVVTLFTERRERAAAIGAFSFVGAAGASIGLVLGGFLTQAASWQWIFFINVPIGIAAGSLTIRVLRPDRGVGLSAGADILGAILVTTGLMLGVYTIVEIPAHGWNSMHTLGFGAASVGLLAAFLVRQTRTSDPLLPLRLLRSRNVSGANAIQAVMVAALYAFQVLAALYLQHVFGYRPATTGLALLPAAVAIGTLSLGFSARLIARFGERRTLLGGLALLVAGMGLLTRVPAAGGNYPRDVLPAMLLLSGFGLAMPALTTLAMSDATDDNAGLVSGLFNTTQQLGAAVGLAVLSTLATARSEQLISDGQAMAVAMTTGYRLAFGVGLALLITAMILSVAVLRRTVHRERSHRSGSIGEPRI